MNKKHQNINKTIKIITPRTDRSHIEIQKHFEINKKKSSQINEGIESFPIVGEIEEFKEPDKINFGKSRFLKSSSSFLPSSSRDFDVVSASDCTSLNKKVEEINKQLADLEKDIQTNFYDPKTSIGSFVQQNPANTPVSLSQFTLNTNVIKNKPPSIQVEIGITKTKLRSESESKKPKSEPTKHDPSAELKSEIMQYRKTIKNKLLEEKMERRLEELNKRNEKIQQENDSFRLPANLAESIRRIQEQQMTSER